MAGKLYLCATPIGNLEDISIRVLNTLKEVDIIAAEDTRHSMKLMNHFEIKTPLTSYYEHNKVDKGKYLVELLLEGKNIALITDAGTPAISDPGEDLVRLCYSEGIKVTSIPGPAACITALTLSGLSTRRFCFEGFLPYDKKEKAIILDELTRETRTIILYEAPHKLKRTLDDLVGALDNRKISLIREITKKFEEVFATTLEEAIKFYKENDPRGEYVLVIEGKDLSEVQQEKKDEWTKMSVDEHYKYYIDKGQDSKEAMKAVAKDRGCGKRDIYQIINNL
ncbi:MAG: rsmI [Clostridiales bacterium]|jgi:16S rRNA (cytidine1402-2'-O)-methyltransferase|nr:rsmI [Clostridiales bacterium]